MQSGFISSFSSFKPRSSVPPITKNEDINHPTNEKRAEKDTENRSSLRSTSPESYRRNKRIRHDNFIRTEYYTSEERHRSTVQQSTWKVDQSKDKHILSAGAYYSSDIPLYVRCNSVFILGLPSFYTLNSGEIVLREEEKRLSAHYWRTISPVPFKFSSYSNLNEIAYRNKDILYVDNFEFDNDIDIKTRSEGNATPFREMTRKDPKNESLWIEYIQSFEMYSQKETVLQKKNRLQNQLEISERAMHELPCSVRIALIYLRLCGDLLEPSEYLYRWDMVLEGFYDSAEFWISYLNMRQTHLSSFSMGSMLELYSEAIRALIDQESNVLYLIRRLVHFLAEAGYVERSISLIQALIELNMSCPDDLKATPFSTKLQHLQHYWKSAGPRFGEAGAEGWCRMGSTVERRMKSNLDMVLFHQFTAKPNKTLFDKWLICEDTKCLNQWRPQRELLSDLDDPEMIVSFDDLRPYLAPLTSASCFELLLDLLRIYGVPVASNIDNDTFLLPIAKPVVPGFHESWPLLNGSIGDKKILFFPLRQGLPFLCLDSSYLETESFWGNRYRSLCNWISPSRILSIRETLTQSCQIWPESPFLAELRVGFEAELGKDRTIQLVRFQLQQFPDSAIYWWLYMQLSASFDEKCDIAVLSLASTEHSPFRWKIILSFVEAAIRENRYANALSFMVHYLNNKLNEKIDLGTQPLQTECLRARSKLEAVFENIWSKSSLNSYLIEISLCAEKYFQVNEAMDIFQLFIWFDALPILACTNVSRKSCVDRIVSSFDRHIEFCHAMPKLKEALFVRYLSSLLLVCQVLPRSEIPLHFIRKTVFSAKESYGKSVSELLYLCSMLETRLQLTSASERILHCKSSRLSIVGWLHAIFNEIYCQERWEPSKIRSLLEKSLVDESEYDSPRRCPFLWQLAIHFEVCQNRLESAKSLSYRAVRECPWSKDLLMFPVRTLSSLGALTHNETIEFINLLDEKELRMHTILDEIGLLYDEMIPET